MLKLIQFYRDIDFKQLQQVYAGSILDTSSSFEQERLAFENFNANTLDFFHEQQGMYAVWIVDGQYKAALRLVKFSDGYLIAGLETEPSQRNRGYATGLLRAVTEKFAVFGYPVYSHVKKDNQTSLRVHYACGFAQLNDCAVLLDGTVSHQYCTLGKTILMTPIPT